MSLKREKKPDTVFKEDNLKIYRFIFTLFSILGFLSLPISSLISNQLFFSLLEYTLFLSVYLGICVSVLIFVEIAYYRIKDRNKKLLTFNLKIVLIISLFCSLILVGIILITISENKAFLTWTGVIFLITSLIITPLLIIRWAKS